MSQSPVDPQLSSPSAPERVTDAAVAAPPAAAPARRRRHRTAGPKGPQSSESAGPPPTAADGAAAPETRAAQSAALTPAPIEQPSTPANGEASARGKASSAREGGRRGSRTRAPQLVVPPAPEPPTPIASAEPNDSAVFGAIPALDTIPALVLTQDAHALPAGKAAPVSPMPAEADAASFEAPIDTRTPDEVTQPLNLGTAAPAPAPRARRYRFDRPAQGITTPPLHPERLRAAPAARLAPFTPAAPAAEPAAPISEDGAAATSPLLQDTPPAAASPGANAPQADLPTATLEEAPALLFSEHLDAAELGTAEAPSTPEGEEVSEVPSARRRRRRRRGSGGNGSGIRHLEAVVGSDQLEPEPTALTARMPDRTNGKDASPEHPSADYAVLPDDLAGPVGRSAASAYAPGQPYQIYGPDEQEPWSLASAYAQIGQPRSPFGAPEPSPARGFGSQPHGAAGPAPERPGRVARSERITDTPPMSANQLGAVVTQAIQHQTDRLLTELRHTQAPPSMTVMFPPFPSTERVGVFVDVANLLYSSRSMRISIDFGRLLEFLRGSRRLVRAQAYTPTNPEPHAEQQFLSVVKGVGYRITTKNYKTFSSGAKKADLDLDLCMDIVRLVDARALDTVILVSGDSDFLPLLEYCSDRGVRVEVAAFDDSAAMILRQSCDLFINLSLVEDIRA